MPAEEMKMRQNGLFAHGLVWCGAALSIAEIEAGMNCRGNLPAVLSGHFLGGLLLFATGLIGARMRRTAMECTSEAFSAHGARLFADLNLLQLVGWTSVMISLGATAATTLFPAVGFTGFCCLIGSLTILWLFVNLKGLSTISALVLALLALLALYLTVRVMGIPADRAAASSVPFVSAFEISVAMPLSWLPLISDYTKDADRPVGSALVSALVYSVVGTWMYVLGMKIAATDAEPSLVQTIVRTGLGTAGLLVVVLSTAISAYYDARSSGESARTVFARLPPELVGVLTCVTGIILAVGGIAERYTTFLAFIASVFAPMAAVLIVTHYFVRRRHTLLNVCAWAIGTTVYHCAGDSPLGPTLTALLTSALLAALGKFPVLDKRNDCKGSSWVHFHEMHHKGTHSIRLFRAFHGNAPTCQ